MTDTIMIFLGMFLLAIASVWHGVAMSDPILKYEKGTKGFVERATVFLIAVGGMLIILQSAHV